MKSVPAEADGDLIGFVRHQTVALAAPDAEQADHDALVADGVEIVEFVPDAEVDADRIEAVGADPGNGIVRLPAQGGRQVRVLEIMPHPDPVARHLPALDRALARAFGAEAHHPDFAERIPEGGGAVAHRRAEGDLLAPVDAVGRAIERKGLLLLVGVDEFEAARRILFLLIQPDHSGVAIAVEHDVGPWHDVAQRLLPMHPVVGNRQSGVRVLPRNVPGLEIPVGRIVPDAVAEGHGLAPLAIALPGAVGPDDGVAGVLLRGVEVPAEIGVLDQEIVDEELAPHVDRNHRRR